MSAFLAALIRLPRTSQSNEACYALVYSPNHSMDDPFSNAYEQPPGKRVNPFQEDLTRCAFTLVNST
jgi:hypothetical protein